MSDKQSVCACVLLLLFALRSFLRTNNVRFYNVISIEWDEGKVRVLYKRHEQMNKQTNNKKQPTNE